MMLVKQRMLLLILLLCGLPLVLLAACGSTSDGNKTGGKNAVTINAYDNYFDPKTINVTANQPVEVTFVNKGTNVHIVEIKGLIAETTMQPGEKKSFTITPQQRSYKLYDELYVSKGMEGAFTGTDKVTSSNNAPSGNVQNAKIKNAVETYRQYVIQQTDALVTSTQQFNDAINAGDLNKAKVLYAPTREYYERIEPIASSFGNLDPGIDAREGDVPDEQWTGFHRIEKALWVDGKTTGLKTYTDQLLKNVKDLRQNLDGIKLVPTDIIDGAVSLLSEASHTKITGEEDRYSHTDLYDLAANVEGSQVAFNSFKDYLSEKNPGLQQDIAGKFQKVQDVLKPFRTDKGFMDYATLKDGDKRAIAQSIDDAGESLSKVAVSLPQTAN
ncbi:iron ABC transporter substrate-binding protein [Ktedonobacter sp. SOSP1-52]|uniref:iron uptake system protein EfeO n=1 Tax=Ktedonobacter sp. SOSP1-52 TaxID=2778366 RepID=UPI0019169F48|nr:iron uptake system protein EfeO [Ktedonobacter sp. SOSP1-52]GHO70681.1 iron ABC transporter substrate-binding protein [Ktedonobacter sp. SOSP1-52]